MWGTEIRFSLSKGKEDAQELRVLTIEVKSKGEGKKPERKEVGENVGYGK